MFNTVLFPSTHYRKICYVFILTLIFLWLGGKHLYAATYYVSPSGNDSYSGMEANPFKTLQKAANIVSAGDTVIVEDGVYQSSSKHVVTISRSGTASKYITFKARNRHGAIIDGNNFTNHSCIRFEGSSYIRIEGFTLRRSEFNGTSTGKWVNNIHLIDNLIQYIGANTVTDPEDKYGRSGIGITGPGSYFTIENNIIHDIGRLPNSSQTHAYRHDHGIYAQGRNHLIQNNTFYNCKAGWGIKLDGYYGDEIPPGDRTHTIRNNRFDPGVSPQGGHIRFYNNNTNSATYGQMKTPVNVLVENNLFWNPEGSDYKCPISITDSNRSNFLGTIIRDNITSAPYMYPKESAIAANIADINNTVNAHDSMFDTEKIAPPFNIKAGSN